MKKAILQIVRPVRYPFYQVMVEAQEEQFVDEEYRIVWEEAEQLGMTFSIEDRLEIFKMLDCVIHLQFDGIDYFYCTDSDAYWEELSIILDKKENE